MTDSPDLRAAKRFLDLAKQQGFDFARTSGGDDAPLRGVRETIEFLDEIVVADFSNSCEATRRRRYSLIMPGGQLVTGKGDGGCPVESVATGSRCGGC